MKCLPLTSTHAMHACLRDVVLLPAEHALTHVPPPLQAYEALASAAQAVIQRGAASPTLLVRLVTHLGRSHHLSHPLLATAAEAVLRDLPRYRGWHAAQLLPVIGGSGFQHQLLYEALASMAARDIGEGCTG
jgi:hypothetical protein